MKKSNLGSFVLLLISICLLLLSGCDKQPKDWDIEYDDHIPDFHGETVRFNKPMAYVIVNQSDASQGYTPAQISLGKKLTASRNLRAYGSDREIIKITDNDEFKILRSFWVRKDWWSSIFTSDWHIVVFEDDDGVKSYALMNIFAMNSNRPEFDSYSNYGQ